MSTPSTPCIAAVDIGGTNLRVALAKIGAPPLQSIIAKSCTSTLNIKDPQTIVDLITSAVHALLKENNLPLSSLKAIAAGAPGITNSDTGVVIVTSYLLGWRNVPLKQLLQDSLHIPAGVDNDGKLAALGESFAGTGSSTPNFVFLAIGTGVSAGIILNSNLHRGHDFLAGEVGYTLLPNLPQSPAPRGSPGHLENTIGGEGIKAQYLAQWSPSKTNLPQSLNATQILDAAIGKYQPESPNGGGGGIAVEHSDPLALSILTHTSHLLASLIYNISLVLNPPLFVLGGSVGTHPALINTTQSLLTTWGTRIQPQLSPSSLGSDAQLYGAIKLALQTANS